MAELAEWSAEALRYEGSDGPVKVMYFRSSGEVGTNDSFNEYYASRLERLELGEQLTSFKVHEALDGTRAVLSGHLFNPEVEVWNSKNYKLQGEEYFDDKQSALEDLASKFNDIPIVVPFDLESSYGSKFPQPSKEEDLLFRSFIEYATNARDIKGREERRDGREKGDNKTKSDGREKRDSEGKKKIEEPMKEEKKEAKKEAKKEEKKEEEKEDKEKDQVKKEDKEKDQIKKEDKAKDQVKKRRKTKQWLEESDRAVYQGVRVNSLCAFIFGITTEFNPSGMWIVEDFFYDEEEVE